MKSLFIIFTLFLSLNSTQFIVRAAPSDNELSNSFSQEDMQELDSLKSETIIKRRDPETGLFLKNYNTYQDKSRISFMAHINKDFESLTSLTAFEGSYAHRFNLAWLEFYVARVNAVFSEITEINSNLDNKTIEQGESESKSTVTFLGSGFLYRSTWIQSIVSSDKMFTTTSAGLGYYLFNNEILLEDFKGLGFKADFGLHLRSSKSMHYGIKMSYHMANVKRGITAEGPKSSTNRALLLNWFSIALDLTFYL